LSSGASITYAHHSLIYGNRRGVIIGIIVTILLAVLFTGLQGLEYSEAPFTIADGAYGSTFFMATGFHGYMLPFSINFYKNKAYLGTTEILKRFISLHYTLQSAEKQCSPLGEENFLTLVNKDNHPFTLNKQFLEWLAGFTDAEGNFSITLRKNKISDHENSITYSSVKGVMLTFQIGLHIDDIKTLEIIKDKLQCGKISISGNRCNYFVNDSFSLIHIVLPIFNFVQLNSTKFSQFNIFKEAVHLFINKLHLTSEGKIKMISYKNKLNENPVVPKIIVITDA
jgi:hypothetical protein